MEVYSDFCGHCLATGNVIQKGKLEIGQDGQMVKVVSQVAEIDSEFLPPHIHVMFTIDKRYEVKEVIDQFPGEVLNQRSPSINDVEETRLTRLAVGGFEPMRHSAMTSLVEDETLTLSLNSLSSGL